MLIRAKTFGRRKSTKYKEGGIGSMPIDDLNSYIIHFDKFIRKKKGTKLYAREMELFTHVARRDLTDVSYLKLLKHCDEQIFDAVSKQLEAKNG